MKKFVALSLFAVIGFFTLTITSADAARRGRGPIIIVTEQKEIVSHS